MGTVLSGWFRLDWLAAFICKLLPATTMPALKWSHGTIRTLSGRARSRRQAGRPPFHLSPRLEIACRRPCKSSPRLSCSTQVERRPSLGRSPTRMGEVLGCGVPVVANEGVGDVADIIRRYNVGVIVKDGSEAAMVTALDELEALRSDPDLPSRCRQAAEEVFSLEAGTEAYRKIYADILGHPDSPEAAPAGECCKCLITGNIAPCQNYHTFTRKHSWTPCLQICSVRPLAHKTEEWR